MMIVYTTTVPTSIHTHLILAVLADELGSIGIGLVSFCVFPNNGQFVCHRVNYFVFFVLFGCCLVVNTSIIG